MQLLSNYSKLQKASAKLTEELKKGHLDVIVWVCVMVMIGLLNIYSGSKNHPNIWPF